MMTETQDKERIITNEGKETIQKYMQNLNDVYVDMGFTKVEIKEIISDMKDHIIHLSSFYADNGTAITSEHILRAIKKVGDPEIIRKTLATDEEIIRELKPQSEVVSVSYNRKKDMNLTVKNSIAIFNFLSWLTTFSSFLLLFYAKDYYRVTPIPLYALILFYVILRTSKAYQHNKTLQESVKINFHMFLYPILHFYFSIFKHFRSLHDPFIITLMLYLISKEWRNIYASISNFVKQSKDKTRELMG